MGIDLIITKVGINNIMWGASTIIVAIIIKNKWELDKIENHNEVIFKDFFVPILFYAWIGIRACIDVLLALIKPIVFIAKSNKVISPESEAIIRFNEKLEELSKLKAPKGIIKIYPFFITLFIAYFLFISINIFFDISPILKAYFFET